MRVILEDRMRRDDLATLIRRDEQTWFVIPGIEHVTLGEQTYTVPILSVWADTKNISPETVVIVRCLLHAATVSAPGINYMEAPFSVVVDGLIIAVRECVKKLKRAKVIAPVS